MPAGYGYLRYAAESMLTQASTLETFAEIFVALAGFAAIAGIVGDRLDPKTRGIGFSRLRAVVLISIGFVFLSLLPLVVSDFDASESRVWRLCSLAAFTLNAVMLWSSVRHGRAFGMSLTAGEFRFFIWPLESVLQLSLVANIFMVLPDSAGSLYLVFLIAALSQASIFFLILLDSTFATSGS
jgi:hypothetical protein